MTILPQKSDKKRPKNIAMLVKDGEICRADNT
ncbi:hypothetical protein TheetDRAFT_2753 [Thermoanaerobacter ethanolicus JW 200]|nr:hypothetical protein TheetDRAFT_2753 [Thermoanaerobacter ethanolicus JW 200]